MKLIALGCLLALSGCVSPKIPDDVPPAPPARKGEPYAAPSSGDDEVEEDGFGGGGFGGETPTVEVDASDLETDEEAEAEAGEEDGEDAAEEKDDATKADGKKKPAKDGDSEAKPKESSEN